MSALLSLALTNILRIVKSVSAVIDLIRRQRDRGTPIAAAPEVCLGPPSPSLNQALHNLLGSFCLTRDPQPDASQAFIIIERRKKITGEIEALFENFRSAYDIDETVTNWLPLAIHSDSNQNLSFPTEESLLNAFMERNTFNHAPQVAIPSNVTLIDRALRDTLLGGTRPNNLAPIHRMERGVTTATKMCTGFAALVVYFLNEQNQLNPIRFQEVYRASFDFIFEIAKLPLSVFVALEKNLFSDYQFFYPMHFRLSEDRVIFRYSRELIDLITKEFDPKYLDNPSQLPSSGLYTGCPAIYASGNPIGLLRDGTSLVFARTFVPWLLKTSCTDTDAKC